MTSEVDVTGRWEGYYLYSVEEAGEFTFQARLHDGADALTGIVVEPHMHGQGTVKAELTGQRTGRDVEFTKTYLDAGPDYTRQVIYSGTISQDGNEITGMWQLPDDTGRFAMKRSG